RVHPAAQRKGGRVCVLQGLPPGRDRAALDVRACNKRHVRLAESIPPAAVVVRLVPHTRAPTWGRGARATQHGRLAFRQRRDLRLGELEGCTGGGRDAASRGWRLRAPTAGSPFVTRCRPTVVSNRPPTGANQSGSCCTNRDSG